MRSSLSGHALQVVTVIGFFVQFRRVWSLRVDDEASEQLLQENLRSPKYVTVLGSSSTQTAEPASLLADAVASSVSSGLYARVSAAQLERLHFFKKREAFSHVASTSLRSLVQEYVGPIGVGTAHAPAGCDSLLEAEQKRQGCRAKEQEMLNVVFDTGSTNLWMASTLCQKGSCLAAGRHRYDQKASQTYAPSSINGSWEVHFATAVLRGPLGIDDFRIGPFTVKNQSFNLIQDEVGTTFEQLPLEGIVGLAFPAMSAGNHLPFFDTVIQQKLLERNLFAFYSAVGSSSSNLTVRP
eukprot:TRINITY_DN18616_c0_g1_i1.p1 TRINITY_DN18616_c0_g1~~TRINITY_DN18616_c0_g1_i1.p1  ORF type:complete len:296 (-),score=62.66 TRINITY_DN18616_c0_g1_i1:585-1472(-)